MKNEMNRENTMRSCRSAMSFLAGVDNRTMRDVVEMTMRSRGTSAEAREEVMHSLFCERAAAAEDYSF